MAVSADERQRRVAIISRVTWVGALINIVLSVAKLLGGWFGQSQALIADGLHSLADLATDALVLVSARFSNRAADEDHPYGHGRIETIATVGLGLTLIAVAVGIIIDAGERLLFPQRLALPTWLAIAAALLSVVAKELLYRYTLSAARRVRSSLLRANAWHHRSDAISSLVVLVGVAGTLAGLPFMDGFAAVVVALMIGKIGWNQVWHSLQELIDRGLASDRLDAIKEIINDVDGVHDLHSLRTRRMGGEALVDVHVQVSPKLSVSEGHQIGEYVGAQLQHNIDEVSDVTVHIDSEDDEASQRCADLPLRRELVAALRQAWLGIVPSDALLGLRLHYLSGRIDVELVLPLSMWTEQRGRGETLIAELNAAAATLPDIGEISVLFQHQSAPNKSV